MKMLFSLPFTANGIDNSCCATYDIFYCSSACSKTKQENHAIAKMTARCGGGCAQYMSALKIFESVD